MKPQRKVHAAENPLASLHAAGQAVWLDFLARGFLREGGLRKLVQDDRLSGVTSNPTIFEKAIGEGADYDAALEAAERAGDLDPMALYEQCAIEDIRSASDDLRPVFDATGGADGYVSLEVSPYLALDTAATIAEARRLWSAVGRENVMIKVPATSAGLPAIRELIAGGINVNITLLFSQEVYAQVAEAYLAGLEALVARGGDPGKVASVASFFVSRIDVAVDKILEGRIAKAKDATEREALAGLRGKVAIANAKQAYQRFKRLFSGPRWEKLHVGGARVQRLLWASTGTKNPAYSDVLYVEELIAADTVNTIPPKTLDAFRDHGRVSASLERGIEEAAHVMAALDRLGISIDAVTAQLVEEGVRSFADAFNKLLGAVARKRTALLGDRLDGQALHLPPAIEKETAEVLEAWRHAGNVRRLWAKDASLWTGGDEARWLGWLAIVEAQCARLGELQALAVRLERDAFTHAVLLGMGGSSLGPEVLAETFGAQPEHPRLITLDSTDPEQIRAVEAAIDVAHTLFIVSSKSGSTLEPDILERYFHERVTVALGAQHAGAHFIAVTDPGSALQEVAERAGFRAIAFGKPDIGGRYSVLSDFGMVPGAVLGLDLRGLLAATQVMVRSCAASAPAADNPAVALGVALGILAQSGRDKLTIVASPGIAAFGAWLEQLVAESTGKRGRGIIPVDAEPLGVPEAYGSDRVFAYLRLAGGEDAKQDAGVDALERAGHPVLRITVADRHQLGQEFFRWEMATAVAGSVLGIDPFDQPDVEASKAKTRALTSEYEAHGKLPAEAPAQGLEGLAAHLDLLHPGDYFALLAYVERSAAHRALLQEMRVLVRDAKRVATCVGFGPRFLHSTGQAYKGGPNTGVFLQVTCDDADDLAVPGRKYTFGVVKAAQARGDLEVLRERGRRVMRVHLGSDVAAGLAHLRDAIAKALRKRT